MTPGDSANAGFEATLRQGLSSIVDAFLGIVGFLVSVGGEPVPTGPDPEEARTARLGEVDIAMGQLATAAAPITDPVLKREADAREAALAVRRTALADAAGDALAGAVADAPGLCDDIAQAVEATTEAVAVQARITAHGTAAALALGTAEALVAGLPGAMADKGVLAGVLAALRTAQTDLATTTDAATLEANAARLATDAQELLVRAQAADALARLLADQDRQVQAVGIANGKLAGALAGLDPLAADPLKDVVADLRLRATALATATGEGAIRTQLGLAGALLTGFADAEAAAVKAEIDWRALAARRLVAKQKLDESGALIGGLVVGAFPKLESDHSQLEITFNGLAGAADMATLTNDLAQLEREAQVLLDAAALAAADTAGAGAEAALDNLDLWEAEFAKIASPTPLTTQCGQLRADWGVASAERDQAARKAAFGVIHLAADQAANTSDDVLKRRSAAANLLAAANNWIATLPSPAGLDVKHAAAEQAIDDLAAASDLGAYESDLSAVEATVQALYEEATTAAAPGQAAAGLADLGVVAARFSAIGTPNPVQTAFDTLTADHVASASLSGKALTTELLRIEAEAFSASQAWDAVDKRRDNARVSLSNADSWIKALDPVAAATLAGRHAAAVKQVDDLAAAPDLTTFESDLAILEAEAQALYDDATTAAAPVQATANLALLGKVAVRFSKIGTPNPVQTAFDTLTADQLASATLSGQALTAELMRIQGDAYTAATEWSAVEQRRDDSKAFLENSDSWIKALDKATAAPLVARYAAAVKAADDLAGAADLATYESDLAALEAAAAALYTDATTAAAPGQAAAGLAQLGPVAAKFSAVATPNPVQTAFDTLTAAHVASASLSGQARTDELVRIQAEAFAAAQKFGATDARATLKDADSWINEMDPATVAPLVARHAAAVKAADDLAAAPDLTTFESQLAALNIEAKALLADATTAAAPGVAVKSLEYLATLAAKFNKLAKPNAVQTLWDTLTAAHTASGTLVDKALTAELTRIQNEAYAASATWDAKVAIDKRLYALSRPIAALGVTGDPMKVESERIKGQYATCCSSATDVAGLVAAFKALDADVDQIAADMRDAQALALDIGTATSEVGAGLLAAQAAVGDLAAGNPKDKAAAELAALQKRESDVPTLVGADAQKRELFALRAEALAFIERVRKLGFEAKLAAGDRQEIDSLIKTFGDTSSDPAQLAVCKAAVSACFKLDLDIPEGTDFTRLPTLFALMAQVPASHVGHDQLTKLEYETDPDMESSYYSAGKIVLNKIGSVGSQYNLNHQTDPTKDERLNYFNATTLHEIGHGVDQKGGIMRSKMGNEDFGGWKNETIDSVATALATNLFAGFVKTGGPTMPQLVTTVTTILKTGKYAPPSGTLPPSWQVMTLEPAFREGVDDCIRVRDADKSPWDNPTPMADGRCYHEGYSGQWFSYSFAQRAKGISNYQWRAPAEWFAELYAFYHLTKKPVPACVVDYITK